MQTPPLHSITYEEVPPCPVWCGCTQAANGASTTSTDDTMVDSDSADDDQDPPAAAKEEIEEQGQEEKEVSPSELPPIPAIFALFVSDAAWAAMSAATRALLVSGVPTLVKIIHRQAETIALARKDVREDEKESRATVGAGTATAAVRIEEPKAASSAAPHCDGISSRQAAADKEALISSSARFAAEQKRVASRQAGRQDSSGSAAVKKVKISRTAIFEAEQERIASLLTGHQRAFPPPRVTPGTFAAISPPLGPHSAPAHFSAPAPQNCAYVYHRKEEDVAFLGILLTVIASYHQRAFGKHDAPAVTEAAGALVSELRDFPGATLAYALGHAAATSSTSSLTTSAHELLLALRAAYRNARRPIAWPQLPPPAVTPVDPKACAVPGVAQRSAPSGETSDRRNGARAPPGIHGLPRRGVDRRRQSNVRDPGARGATSKVGLNGRRLGKEKGKVFGNGRGRGRCNNVRARAVPHPLPAAAFFAPPAAAALPPFGGARPGLQPGP